MINSNGHPILYRFEVIAYCCFNFGHCILQLPYRAYGQHMLFILGLLESA